MELTLTVPMYINCLLGLAVKYRLPVEHTVRSFDVCFLFFTYDLYLVYDLYFSLALFLRFGILV